jgi:hypothetical protein
VPAKDRKGGAQSKSNLRDIPGGGMVAGIVGTLTLEDFDIKTKVFPDLIYD